LAFYQHFQNEEWAFDLKEGQNFVDIEDDTLNRELIERVRPCFYSCTLCLCRGLKIRFSTRANKLGSSEFPKGGFFGETLPVSSNWLRRR
jgi:hypothetical protein